MSKIDKLNNGNSGADRMRAWWISTMPARTSRSGTDVVHIRGAAVGWVEEEPI